MSTQPVFSTSSLIFPLAAQNLSQTLSSIRRSTLSISNRLHSCKQDALFVESIAQQLRLPLVANERCGSWYIPPDKKAGSAYFKSTDGHTGQWSFSLRRLNIQVLDIITQFGGCIIVDSTRRGKNMPDALSKTVPIWCTVLNRTLFPEFLEYHALSTPSDVVGASEHAQIEARLDSFVNQFKELDINVEELRKKLKKPLRVTWVTQNELDVLVEVCPEQYHTVVLCTASYRVRGAEASGGGYIQGAGDDSEGWSLGLTADMFWANEEMLLSANEADLSNIIHDLVEQDSRQPAFAGTTLVKPTQAVYIATLDALVEASHYDVVIACSNEPLTLKGHRRFLNLHCAPGKHGSRDLRKGLIQVKDYVASILLHKQSLGKCLLLCPTGKDLAVGVALLLLCTAFDQNGNFCCMQPDVAYTKQFIRQRLAWITLSKPDANPSRSTLQAVNSVLISRP